MKRSRRNARWRDAHLCSTQQTRWKEITVITTCYLFSYHYNLAWDQRPAIYSGRINQNWSKQKNYYFTSRCVCRMADFGNFFSKSWVEGGCLKHPKKKKQFQTDEQTGKMAAGATWCEEDVAASWRGGKFQPVPWSNYRPVEETGGECFLPKKDGKDPKAEEKPLTEDKRNIFVFQPETPSGRIDIRRERNHIFRPKWNTKKEKIFKR